MDKYIKRIQSKLSYKGIKASKQQCRDAYSAVVSGSIPTDGELDLVVENLASQLATTTEAPSIGAPPAVIEITPEMPSIWETLQPPADDDLTETGVDEEVNQLSLAVSDNQAITPPSPGGGITPQQIQDAVEQRFADRPNEIKAQVVQYATQSTFGSAKELEQMLEQLRQVELSVMLQIINTHNTQRLQTLVAFRDALGGADTKRKEESQAFFAQFSQELEQMKAAFGVS